MNRSIPPQAWATIARDLEIEEASLRAVAAVESAGSGFLPPPSTRPKILFEGHIFHRQTGGRFDAAAPTLSYPRWDRSKYARSAVGEWRRLDAAIALDRAAALRSASWGAFQIMGFNHALCGFDDVEAFVAAHEAGAEEQLAAFARFIDRTPYLRALRTRDWKAFAAAYNGPGYASNHYDTRLAAAYAEFRRGGT